ncbi:SAM-dependent methyltransferase [Aquabacterium soli]|uniref:site-specific DNA-methyltransferase (adenine-specific) n=2 Tax=Aquabacterium soli TaxID=2493092 RepID=A0A3R8S5U5_9BURK|nr:SAM-dependent methyltransferase [Aquabacterium soli]
MDLFGQTERGAAIDALHEATAIYTSEAIVEQLLDRIRWPLGARTLVDTSCGDGAFLGRALDRLLSQQAGITDTELLARVSGWEIHFFAADQARARLRQVLLEHGYPGDRAESISMAMIRCADFLTEGPTSGAFHAIVGNPPYLRFSHVPELLRMEYAGILPEHARADLLHSFLDRCAALLHPDGELAMVTADRWLFNDGAARLREVVGQRFGLAHVSRLDAASAFYRPKLRRANTPPRVHPVAVVLSRAQGALPIGREPIYPGENIGVPAPAGVTLGQVAAIQLAPWLGTPGVFLVNANTAARLPVAHLVPAVDSADIRDGLLMQPTRFAIVTRPGEEPHPEVIAHLKRERQSMCARGQRRVAQWLPPENVHDVDVSCPSLLVPRITRTLRPVLVPPGVLPINHNLRIVCTGAMSLTEIEAHLCSPESEAWLRQNAAPLESGFRALTARSLRSLPIKG